MVACNAVNVFMLSSGTGSHSTVWCMCMCEAHCPEVRWLAVLAGSTCQTCHGLHGVIVLQASFICKIYGLIPLSGHSLAQSFSYRLSSNCILRCAQKGLRCAQECLVLDSLLVLLRKHVVVKTQLAVSYSQQNVHSYSQRGSSSTHLRYGIGP